MSDPSNPLDWEAAKESIEIANQSASLRTRFWG